MADKVIQVKEVHERLVASGRNEGAPYLQVVDTSDKKYSIFDRSLFPMFKEGATIMLEGEYKGQFFNVSGAKVPSIEEAAKSEGAEVVKTETARTARSTSINDSIESQVAFKGAVELIVADKLDIKGEIGEKVRKWISERI